MFLVVVLGVLAAIAACFAMYFSSQRGEDAQRNLVRTAATRDVEPRVHVVASEGRASLPDRFRIRLSVWSVLEHRQITRGFGRIQRQRDARGQPRQCS